MTLNLTPSEEVPRPPRGSSPSQLTRALLVADEQVTDLKGRRRQATSGRRQERSREQAGGTNLVGPHVAAVKVGVAGGRVDAVLLKVLTDVLRGGLGQQPVNALPGEEISKPLGKAKRANARKSGRE